MEHTYEQRWYRDHSPFAQMSVQRAFLFLPQEKEQNMKKKYAGAILILLLLITVSIGVLRLWIEQPEVRFSEKDAFQTEAFEAVYQNSRDEDLLHIEWR